MFFCCVLSTSESSAVCVTSPNVIPSEGLVEMKFDRAEVPYSAAQFRYVTDPNISDIEPQKSILR